MPTATTTPKPAAGLKKLNRGGIATATKDSKKTDYPTLPDPEGEVARLVADLRQQTELLESTKGAVDLLKGELTSQARAFWFQHGAGKAEVPSSVSATDGKGNEVLVTFSSRYYGTPDDAAIVAAIGPELAERFFRQSFEVKVNGDLIPAASQQAIIDGITALFAKHNATEALAAKAVIKPSADYHAARHASLTPEQNLALERLCPCTPMVKTKGRKRD